FLGDDAFGVEVVRQLAGRTFPEGVRIVDFGIRGLDLAYALLDEPDAVILIDVLQRGGPPGTLYVFEPELADASRVPREDPMVETHGMHPAKVMRMVSSLGGHLRRMRVIGCEPATFGTEEEPAMGLSEPVQAAVPAAVALVESEIRNALEMQD